ncbi:MAG: leucine--tRNA ligase [Ignavibacteriales bacterium]|nr:leucine--tRNA ligase [Ignavibacteriales bacterium]
MKYPFQEIETKWQKRWEEEGINKANLSEAEKKLYALVMFIYPSAAKMHIGHWFNYGPTDTWARLKKLQGNNVFEPIGYDAFGLPAENYAIKTGIHPHDSTLQNVNDIRDQLKTLGAMYDFDYEVNTSLPEYYKWTQWLFLLLYKNKLAYRQNAPVNWCSKDATVLANEQVVDGKCERCGTEVIRKNLTQWFFKITNYAEELLQHLDKIDWPEKTKTMQRNWIGKSVGIEIEFAVASDSQSDKSKSDFESDSTFRVFTTRPDTLFGVTYVVLAPEHSLLKQLTTSSQKNLVENYLEEVKKETEIERQSTTKEKTGVFTGSYAINPINNEKIPIWIADYVLATYGTGAVMGVPGHDERDFILAKKFSLPIKKVILEEGKLANEELQSAFCEVGTLVNSGKFDGFNSEIAKEKISDELEKIGKGKRKINFRLRDWLVSRQRYWGAPIPIVYCESCGEVPIPENQLPVLLPYNVDFRLGGESPLARSEEFVNTTCPNCGKKAKRDVDTMDTFVDSSWYFLRYPSSKNSEVAFEKNVTNQWLPVDKYVGGAEHAVMHLLYARFITKVLRDTGYINFDEPFLSLVHQGTITNKGAKMSKSRGNVVNPGTFTEQYGGDVFRLYLMFMRPYDESGDWNDEGIQGTWRFVNRIYQLLLDNKEMLRATSFKAKYEIQSLQSLDKILYRKTNQTLKKVEENIHDFHFNTAISSLMELLNELTNSPAAAGKRTNEITTWCIHKLIIMLAPLAPHFAEELNEMCGGKESLFKGNKWIRYDETAIAEDEVTIAIQINGKLRDTMQFPIDSHDEIIKQAVLQNDVVKKYVDGKAIAKVVVVKNKLISIVVK